VSGADDTLRERLVGLAAALMGPGVSFPDPFPWGLQLSELGISSLKMVNFMLAIETEFDVAIPPADINPDTFYSVDSIAVLVNRLTAPRISESR
jgi:hypothetical protein